MTKFFAVAASLFALTACSSAPSESDITQAVTKMMDEYNQTMANIGGGSVYTQGMVSAMKIEIKSVKKIGCKADGEKAYLCDVEVEAKSASGVTKNASPVRFVKGSDGWVASK